MSDGFRVNNFRNQQCALKYLFAKYWNLFNKSSTDIPVAEYSLCGFSKFQKMFRYTGQFQIPF